MMKQRNIYQDHVSGLKKETKILEVRPRVPTEEQQRKANALLRQLSDNVAKTGWKPYTKGS